MEATALQVANTPKVVSIFTKDNGPTQSEALLMKILAKAHGTKTVDEIAAEIGAARGKPYKRGSAVTAISQLRARFSAPTPDSPKGKPFGVTNKKGEFVSFEPKGTGGQGRKADRADIDDVMGDLQALVA